MFKKERFFKQIGIRGAFSLLAGSLLWAVPAHAVTQLALTSAVSGPGAPLHPSGGPDGFDIGAVATFTVNKTIENAVITPDFFCIDCEVRFDLHSEAPDLEKDDRSYISSLLLTTPFYSLTSSIDPVIDVGTLFADTTYSLVATARSDISIWQGSTEADLDIESTGSVTRVASYRVPSKNRPFTTTLAQSLIEPSDAHWLYKIEGTVSAAPSQVPLPSGVLLLGTALPTLTFFGRRRQKGRFG